jgi:hypothetical protein
VNPKPQAVIFSEPQAGNFSTPSLKHVIPVNPKPQAVIFSEPQAGNFSTPSLKQVIPVNLKQAISLKLFVL